MTGADTRFDCVLQSPIGRLGIHLHAGRLSRVEFLTNSAPLRAPTSPVASRVATELEGYFEDPQQRFNLPLAPAATPFQQRLLALLSAIPSGQTRSYGELAVQLDSGARAVGNACRRNPLAIVVPCHRVVGASGVGGYAGHTAGPALRRKLWLLEHEGVDLTPLKTS